MAGSRIAALGIFIMLFALVARVAAAPERCRAAFNGHCWNMTTSLVAWSSAPTECGSYWPASFHNQNEWNFACGHFAPLPGEIWIGGYEPQSNDPIYFINVDGTPYDWWPAGSVWNGAAPTNIRITLGTGNTCGVLDDTTSNVRQFFCKGPPARTALYITSLPFTTDPHPCDVPLLGALMAAGYSYVYINDTSIDPNTLTGWDLIWVASSTATGSVLQNIAQRLQGLPIPIICTGQTYVLNATGIYISQLAGVVETTGTITAPGHPLAGGLTGSINFASANYGASNTQTFGATQVVADSSGRSLVAAFEKGTSTPYGIQPARRIQLSLNNYDPSTDPVSTTIINAAIRYASPKLVVTIPPPPYYVGVPFNAVFSVEDGNGSPLNHTVDVQLKMYRNAQQITALIAGDPSYHCSRCFKNNTWTTRSTQFAAGEVWWFMNFQNGSLTFPLNLYKPGYNISLDFLASACVFPYVLGARIDGLHVSLNPNRTTTFNFTSLVFTLPTLASFTWSITDVYGKTSSNDPVVFYLHNADTLVTVGTYNTFTSPNGAPTLYNLPYLPPGNYSIAVYLETLPAGTSPVFRVAHGPLTQWGPIDAITTMPASPLTLADFRVVSQDAFGNAIDDVVTLVVSSPGSAPLPMLLGTTTLAINGSGVARFTGVTFDRPGCFVIHASVGGHAFESPLLCVQMPAPAMTVLATENIEWRTSFEAWHSDWVWTLLSNSCTANVTVDVDATGSTAALVVPAMDYETMAGHGSCAFEFNINDCPSNTSVSVTVANVYEPLIAVSQTLHLTERSPLGIVLGDVFYSELKTRDELTTTLINIPTVVIVYPYDANATTVADLAGVPLTADLLPLTLTTTGGHVTLVYNNGAYNNTILYTLSDTVTTLNLNMTIFVNVSCPDPVGMFLSGEGFCVCSDAAFINLEGNCQECLPGTYYSGQQIANPCFQCPTGGSCPGGPTPPTALPGYYCVPNAPVPATAYDKCAPDAACLGGCVCRTGHTGPTCSTCLNGYYKDNSLCEPCPSTSVVFLTLIAIAMVIVCAALIKVARRSTTYFTSLSVGFNFLQVVSVLAEFRLQWPPFVLAFLNALSVVNLNINLVQPECAFAGGSVPYFPIWVFKLCIPLIFLLIFLVAYFGAKAYAAIRASINEINHPWVSRFKIITGSDLIILKNSCINAYFTVLVLLYLNIMSTALEIYSCDDQGHMVKDTSYKCGEGEYYKLVAISAVCSVVYGLGIPAVFYGVLRINRMNLLKELTIIKFGLLYRRYKHELFMWEIAILWRKLGIILGLLFFGSKPIGAACFALAALVIAFGLQLYFQPYVSKRVNFLETVHLTCGSIVLLCGLTLAGVTSTGNQSAITGLGTMVILIVVANCLVLFYVVFQELRYQYRLLKRGVQGGFASDEVMVDDFFFHHDFFIKEMSRNVMGTTSTIVLTSKTECTLRVAYTDSKSRVIDLDDKQPPLHSWVQSNGFLHVIVTTFHNQGRFGLRVFAQRATDKTEDELVTNKDLVENMTRGQRALHWLRNVYRRNEAGTVPTFAYHLNCDVRPRVALSFPKVTGYAKRKGVIVMHPNFFELTPQAKTSFRFHGDPIKAVLAPSRPLTVAEAGVIPFTFPKDPPVEQFDEFFKATHIFVKPGPIHLWCQFALPKTSQQEFAAMNGNTLASVKSMKFTPGNADSFAEIGAASGRFESGRFESSRFDSVASGAALGDQMAFEDDDHDDLASFAASQGKFVRCASFEVLEQHAGWTELGVIESEIMGILCNTDDAAAGSKDVEMDVANPIFLDPPTLESTFTARRGLLYTPRTRTLVTGVTNSFEVILPGATVLLLSPSKPKHDADGAVLFKREDNVYNCRAAFPSVGPLFLWARLASMETSETRLSARPTISDFIEVVTFELVAP